MPRLRKKPVEIEARRVREDNIAEISVWCHGMLLQRKPRIEIDTLEGVMTAHIGDWIIRGVAGEFYPCKPDIFAATYEPAEKPETDT